MDFKITSMYNSQPVQSSQQLTENCFVQICPQQLITWMDSMMNMLFKLISEQNNTIINQAQLIYEQQKQISEQRKTIQILHDKIKNQQSLYDDTESVSSKRSRRNLL